MVLVGRTGSGKSASGNTILGKKYFKSTASPSSVTSVCQKETAEFEGQNLSVIDTPGLFDTRMCQKDVTDEIARCMIFCAPGPNVFLVVVQAGRFTEEEQETVKLIKRIFGEKAKSYTMVLFTHGDDLEENRVDINNFIKNNPSLQRFISQCGGERHLFNNRSKDPSQVRELLKKVNRMVQQNVGTYYTNEMLQEAQRVKRKIVVFIMNQIQGIDVKEAIRKAENESKWALFTSLMVTGGAALRALGGPIGAVAGATAGGLVASACRLQ